MKLIGAALRHSFNCLCHPSFCVGGRVEGLLDDDDVDGLLLPPLPLPPCVQRQCLHPHHHPPLSTVLLLVVVQLSVVLLSLALSPCYVNISFDSRHLHFNWTRAAEELGNPPTTVVCSSAFCHWVKDFSWLPPPPSSSSSTQRESSRLLSSFSAPPHSSSTLFSLPCVCAHSCLI